MGSLWLRGNSWVGEYRDGGKIKRETFGKKGIITKTQAKEMLKKREQRVTLRQYGMVDVEIPTLSEFIKSYLKHQADVKQIRSHERTNIAINHFIRFYGSKKLSEFTAEDIDIYKQKRLREKVKLGTVKRELNVIRHLFNQAKRWKKFFGENPVSQSGMPEVHDQRERVLTPDEERKLINVSPEPLKDILLIALNTGMRLGEILGLRWKWIDLNDNIIHLPQTHTKSKESRKVPVNLVIRRILLEKKLKSGGNESVFPSESKYGLRERVKRLFKIACQKAEIEGLRFHDLRHTAGTRLGEAGIPLQTISKLLGHTTTRITERYVHPSESIREATEILANFSRVTDKSTDTEEKK